MSILAPSLELSGHPQAVGLEENAFLSHLGAWQASAQLRGPSSQTAGPPAGADKSAGEAEPLMQLISERGMEVKFFYFFPLE